MIAPRPANWLLAVLWLTHAGAAVAAREAEGPAGPEVEVTRDLAADAAAARAAALPILLAVTREDCRYCALLKREILVPMLRSGEYRDKVLIRELVIEPSMAIKGFDGLPTDSVSVAEALEATLSPTVLLLAPDGRRLEPPIRGINNAEFYGYYLDQAIGRALTALRTGSDTESTDHGVGDAHSRP